MVVEVSSTSSSLPPSIPVGSVWQKVEASSAVNVSEREAFWKQTEQEEKARLQQEAKKETLPLHMNQSNKKS